MKFTKIVAVALVLMLLAASSTQAQLSKPGINGAAFLKIGVGARMVALGSAVTTVSGDPNMLFWNPAGIVLENGKTQATFTYNSWIADLNHQAGAVNHSFGNLGTLGVGFIYMGLSDIAADRDIAPPGFESAQIDQATSATYNYNDLAFILGYSKQFTDRFRMGASFKYIREHIDDVTATAFAFDFGAIYDTGFRDLTLGARLNNVGKDLTFYAQNNPIPLNFSIGASMSIAKEEHTNLRAFFDFTKPQDNPQLYFIGGEWSIYKTLMLRGGYKFNYSGIKDDVTGNPQTDEGFSFGGGLDLYQLIQQRIWLDYAMTDFDLLSDTHRFTLRFEF